MENRKLIIIIYFYHRKMKADFETTFYNLYQPLFRNAISSTHFNAELQTKGQLDLVLDIGKYAIIYRLSLLSFLNIRRYFI